MEAGAHLWEATPLDRQQGTDRWPTSQIGWDTSFHPWQPVSFSLISLPKERFTASPNSATSWGPSVQTDAWGEGLQFILKS